MFYVVLRCIWYRQKMRGRSPTLGGRFPPKRKKSIDLETVVREGRKFPSFPSHCLNYSKWASSRFRWAQSHP
jgi:hypothetical protein